MRSPFEMSPFALNEPHAEEQGMQILVCKVKTRGVKKKKHLTVIAGKMASQWDPTSFC